MIHRGTMYYYNIILILILCVALFGLFGCNNGTSDSEEQVESKSYEYYHIIFHRNYGENDVTVDVAVSIDGNKFPLPDCTDDRIGFDIPTAKKFKSWSSEPTDSGVPYNIGYKYSPLKIKAGKSVDLYAIWDDISYTIIFNANGGSGSMSPQKMTGNASASLSDNTFYRVGYDFVKWDTDPNGNGTSYTNKQSVSSLTTIDGSEIILYAIWEYDHSIIINETTYLYTGFVKVMDSPVTIIGSDDNWRSFVAEDADSIVKGVFPAGRTVTLSPYYIGKYEVTQQLYESVMNSGKNYDKGKDDYCPAYYVNWYHAITFCNKLSLLTEMTPCYSVKVNGNEVNWASLSYNQIPTSSDSNWHSASVNMNADGYRLPTEAEWEFAARGGDQSKSDWTYAYAGVQSSKLIAAAGETSGYYYETDSNVYWLQNDDNLQKYAWYKMYSDKQHQLVGQKLPNRLGLFDMCGNVNEWCWDRYDTNKDNNTAYLTGEVTDPLGIISTGFNRMTRGGECGYMASYCAVTNRYLYFAENENNNSIGFRLARSVK